MGVDVARFGDDATIIRFRRGRDARSIPPIKLRGADTMEVAARIADERARFQPGGIFIDGGGVGGGVVDRCRQIGLMVTEVQFGGKADRTLSGRTGISPKRTNGRRCGAACGNGCTPVRSTTIPT
jgi:hypothetical protein